MFVHFFVRYHLQIWDGYCLNVLIHNSGLAFLISFHQGLCLFLPKIWIPPSGYLVLLQQKMGCFSSKERVTERDIKGGRSERGGGGGGGGGRNHQGYQEVVVQHPPPVPAPQTAAPTQTYHQPPPQPPLKPSHPNTRAIQKPDTILGRPFDDIKHYYTLGKELGRGQFGVTYLCTQNSTGNTYACKSILKRKLVTKNDKEDIKREIQIMQHLTGQPNIVEFKGAYEDRHSVHLVMELCAGGELFDRIISQGHYSERAAAAICRAIVNVVHICHFMGVMHRDLKPENFLLSSKDEAAMLKATDFGLSVFIEEGEFLILLCHMIWLFDLVKEWLLIWSNWKSIELSGEVDHSPNSLEKFDYCLFGLRCYELYLVVA